MRSVDSSSSSARPGVLVVGHERSGTHFLMNSLAQSRGYVAAPWVDFDSPPLAINFFDPLAVAATLESTFLATPGRIVKSHHQAEFFAPIIELILARYVVLYIHRHPADVLASFWTLLSRFTWHEGPDARSLAAFAAAAPEGRLLRYQWRQESTMLRRWESHVAGWRSLADRHSGIQVIAYEDLRDRYHDTIAALTPRLGPALNTTPPSRTENVIAGGPRRATPTEIEALRVMTRRARGADGWTPP